MTTQSHGTSKQRKRPAPKTAWKPGQSGNPGGRKKGGDSFASVLREFLGMSGPAIAGKIAFFKREFAKLPDDVDLRSLIALRWITSIMNEPTPGLMKELLDRTDGPVPTKIEGSDESPLTIKVVYVKRNGFDSGAIGAASQPTVSEGSGEPV